MSEERLPGASPGELLGGDEVERDPDLTDIEVYQGDLEALGGTAPDGATDVDPLTDLGLQVGETDDPNVAAEEGLAWVPPIDPPIAAEREADGDPVVGAGFAVDAVTPEPYDADHHAEVVPDEDEVEARVRDALRADARTTALADRLELEHEGDRLVIAGLVDDLDDEDDVVEVASRASGIGEVVSRLAVRSVDELSTSD